MYNFSFLDLFEGNAEIIYKIILLSTKKLKEFLLKSTDIIDKDEIDLAIENSNY